MLYKIPVWQISIIIFILQVRELRQSGKDLPVATERELVSKPLFKLESQLG